MYFSRCSPKYFVIRGMFFPDKPYCRDVLNHVVFSGQRALKVSLAPYCESNVVLGCTEVFILLNQRVMLPWSRNVLRGRYYIGCYCREGIGCGRYVLDSPPRTMLSWSIHIRVSSTHHIVVISAYRSHLSAGYYLVKTYWRRLRYNTDNSSGNMIRGMH